MRVQLQAIAFLTTAIAATVLLMMHASHAEEPITIAAITNPTENTGNEPRASGFAYEPSATCQNPYSAVLAQFQVQRSLADVGSGQMQAQLQKKSSGETYIQTEDRNTFRKLKAGESVSESLDCIEIECPASFPADATCWRCREQIKAPSSGSSTE